MVVAMIESQAGLNAADEIAAVEGVDMLLVGANDLSVELGVPGRWTTLASTRPSCACSRSAKANGKAMGIGGLGGRPDLIRKYLELGAGYVSTGNDISFLHGRGHREAAAVRLVTPHDEGTKHEDLRLRRGSRRWPHRRPARGTGRRGLGHRPGAPNSTPSNSTGFGSKPLDGLLTVPPLRHRSAR